MILARILVAIIIGGLALIGYLLYLLAAINSLLKNPFFLQL